MDKINKEPAAPILDHNYQYLGLTKREHFAGLALQGIKANEFESARSHTDISIYAVSLADALLEELEK